MKVSQTSRDFRKLDQQKFCNLLEDRFSEIPQDCDDPDKLCNMYESITSSILDELCPTTTKERIVKAPLPWYNDNIHQERRVRRLLERKWRKTRNEDGYSALLVQKGRVNKLIVEAKQGFFTDTFLSSNTKEMFKTLPIANSDVDLANDFLTFFVEKVEKIRSKITADTGYEQETRECETAMPCFEQLSNSDVAKIIGNLSSKSCSLDALPSWIIKQNLDCLLHIISRIVNSSLVSGVFPETLKHSITTPIIKKVTMDPNILKSYRPVVNIKFIAKIIEKAASSHVIQHVNDHNLGEMFQSAHKAHHSIKTALLQVKNNIMQSLDDNKVILLVLLDLNAAFDTIDHGIVIDRLKTRFGINGAALQWFKTYLKDRSTRVMINNIMSQQHILNYSVPQGSIVGPQGFIMYTHPVGDIIRAHNICFHTYADDTQLFCDFNPKIPGDCERALGVLTSCVSEINTWMCQNMLQLNQEIIYCRTTYLK